MEYQLVVVRGRSEAPSIKLGSGVTIVGRQAGCGLVIASSQVSRKHCQFFERGGKLHVKDLGSSNGTFVNGARIDEEQELNPGDEITVGQVRLRLDGPGAATARPADTAVRESPAVEVTEDVFDADEFFEIDMDEPADETTKVAEPQPAAAAKPAPAPAAAKAQPAPAAKAPEPEPAPEDAPTQELGEDAVADFLMSINLDEGDKR